MRIFLCINLLLLASCATKVDGNHVASGKSCNARADQLIDAADRAADIAQDALDKAESEPTQENADAARARSLEASEKAVAAAEFRCGA